MGACISKMDELINQLITLAIGFIGGLVIGFALRKIIKIALVIGGAMLLVLIVLQGMGWVNPNYDKMTVDAQQFVNNTEVIPQLNQFTANFSPLVLVGLAIGGVIGFVKTG